MLTYNFVGVDAHIDPRADVGIRPYNLNPSKKGTEKIRSFFILFTYFIAPAMGIGELAPLDAGEVVVELLGDLADFAVADRKSAADLGVY